MTELDIHDDAWVARIRAEHERLGSDCPCHNPLAWPTSVQEAQRGASTPKAAIGPTPEVHDPTGRLCALAGRYASGYKVDDYCRPCYDLILADRILAERGWR